MEKPRLLEKVRSVIHFRHSSRRREEVCRHQIKTDGSWNEECG